MTYQNQTRVREILAAVSPLAAEFYALTGKPLGVTGEVAEYAAAEKLGLALVDARTPGYDALRQTPDGLQRIQIKGRAFGEDAKPGQRISRIKTGAPCDIMLLVLLDNATLDPREMWEAPFAAVQQRLAVPGSKSRDRGSLGVAEFKHMARRVWPTVQNTAMVVGRLCPECSYAFKGNGFDGIDAHWRARHTDVMPYEQAWPLIKAGTYPDPRKR